MIYLIHYDRSASALVDVREFADRELANTERARLELSLLTSGEAHEVVLLEADSLESLKNTHSRYFKSFDEIAHKRSDTGHAEPVKPIGHPSGRE